MSNNPSLSVEFKAINESPVIQSIDRVSSAGQTYLEKWVEQTKSAAFRNEAAYTGFWKRTLAEQDRATREMFQMARTRQAEEARLARQREREESAASRAIIQQRKIETNALIAEGKRAIAEQKANRAQLNLENRVVNAGGYGPSLPSAPAQPSDFFTKINAGMVNAAAAMTLIGQAYGAVKVVTGVIGDFISQAAKWEAMDMGLRNMEGSAEGAARATERLYEIAKAPGIDLETATKGYTQLRAMHMAGKDAERTIVDISNTVARAGGGSVGFERTMNQLKDMLATGTVYQKDLKIMKEAMPELTNLMQKAFGTTTAEGIRKLGVNSNAFLQGILVEMEKLPKAQQTLTSEIENSEVALSRLKAAFVDTNFTKKVLADWTSMLEGMTKVLNAKEINWSRLIGGIISGRGVEQGAYANGKQKDIAEVTSFFDKMEAKDVLTGMKAKAGKNYVAKDKEGRTRQQWLDFIEKKWTPPEAPNSEGVAAGDKKDEKKKKYDPIAADQERLRQMLEAQDEETRIRERYNATVEWLTREGVDSEAAIARANRDKMTEEVALKFQKMENLAHGNEDLLTRIRKESSEQQLATYAKYDAEVQAIDAKIEAREDAKAITAKIKAVQREIDKGEEVRKTLLENEKRAQEALQAYKNGEQLRAETDGLFAIELEYRNHYERINAAIFDSETQKKAMLDEFRGKEIDALNEFKMAQINIGLSGASGLFGAMAEMRKSATSEMNDSYRAMFAISKGFAIAEASLNVYGAVSKAMNDWSTANVYGRIALAGSVMAQGGNLISQISSLTYSGMFDRGGNIRAGQWGIAGENGPEIIQGPAHVTSTRDTARLMGSGSGGNITVNNYAGATVSTTKNANGDWEILIQRAAEAAEDRISAGIASGGGKVSQQLTRTFGVKR